MLRGGKVVNIFSNRLVAVVLVSFLLGWIGSSIYFGSQSLSLEKPLGMFESAVQKSAPADRVKDYNIKIFSDKVVIYLEEPYMAKFADTHSMEPVLDKKSTGLELVPASSAEIKVGDIVSYASKGSTDIIIHRVVKLGQDSEGWYAIAKGDNNASSDPEKIRFGQVKRILVGILY